MNDHHWHRPFDFYCQFHHNGDCKAAVKAVAEKLRVKGVLPGRNKKANGASPKTTEVKADQDPGRVKILADLIEKSNHFAQDGGGKLYRYQGGAFRPKAENYVKAEVKRLCLAMGMTGKWSSRLASEVVEFIQVDSPELRNGRGWIW